MTVKEIMLSPTPQIPKTKTNVKDSFQKLDYLKKIPKRIDWWLSKDSKTLNKNLLNSKGYNNKFLQIILSLKIRTHHYKVNVKSNHFTSQFNTFFEV